MRVHNLEALRTLAALAVALAHLGGYAQMEFGADTSAFGSLGSGPQFQIAVPIFFTLSGFVLTQSLHHTPAPRFLFQRLARLYPAFWLALLVVKAVYKFGLWPGRYLAVAGPNPSVDTALLIPPTGFRLGMYPLMVEWTLIYEVFLSIALLGMWVLVGPRRLTVAVGLWLAALAVKSVGWPNYGSDLLPTWKGIGLSARLVPFLLGVLLFFVRTRGASLRLLLLAVALALTLAVHYWAPVEQVDIRSWALGVAAAMTVWGTIHYRDLRGNHPLVILGGWSYGLYLVHVPVMLLSFRMMQAIGVLEGSPAGVGLAGLAALTVGFGFGRFESRLYARARKWKWPEALSWGVASRAARLIRPSAPR